MPSPSISSVGTAYTTPNNATNPMTATGGSMPTHATGDVLLMFAWFDTGATTAGQTLDTPSGWTSLGVDADDLANGMLFHVYFRYAASASETFTSPSFAGGTTGTSGATGIVQVATLRAPTGYSFNSNVSAGQLVANSSTATFFTSAQQNIGAITGFTPDENNTLVVVYGGKRDDWTSVATLTGDSLTWTEQGEPVSTSGGDAGMVWDTAPQTTAGAITAKTFTVTGGGTEKSAGRMFALSATATAMERSAAVGATGAIDSAGVGISLSPYWVANGTGAGPASTALTPGIPAGIATDDILLLFHTNRETSSAPTFTDQAGGTWTQVADSPQLPVTTATDPRLSIFWSRYNGTQTAPTIAADSGGNNARAIIAAFRGCATTGNPWDVTAGGVDTVLDTSAAIPGDTTTVDNCLVVAACTGAVSVATTFSGWTNASLASITERIDTGGSVGIGVAVGVKLAAGTYSDTTATLDFATPKGMISIALKPPAVATLERSASLTAGGAIASAPQRDLLRQAAISASGAIASSAIFWTTFERSIAITASGSIASSGEIDTVGEFNRSASLDAVASIVSAPQRDLLRQVAIAAAGVIQSAGSTSEILERSVAISATTAIASAGSVTSIGVSAIPERREVIASIAAEIELPNGALLNLNPDEGVDRIPISASFDTEIPGGFSAASLTIARPEYINVPDLLYGSTRFYVYESNRTLHEGRVVGISDNGTELSLEIEPWSKHLTDNKTAREIFYDRDLSHWGGASVQYKLNEVGNEFMVEDASLTPDPTTGSPSMELTFSDTWTDLNRPQVIATYDASMLDIGGIDYAWRWNGIGASSNMVLTFAFYEDDLLFWGTPYETTTDRLTGASSGSGTLTAAAAGRHLADIELYAPFNSGSTVAGYNFTVWGTMLALWGRHGLPLQGSVAVPSAGRGLYAHHVIDYIVDTFAPLLTSGDIETTTFVIPHLVFLEPTTAFEMIEAITIYGGDGSYPLDWGVYDDRTFFAASPFSYGNVWHARLDEGAEATDAGADVQRLITGVMVTYDDGSGTKFSVGPVNSGANYETATLEDTDEGNPATRDGADHWEVYDAGITSGPTDTMTMLQKENTGAVLIGRLILAERNRQEWRGDVTIKDAVRDDAGNWHPVAMMRSGDRLIIEDDPDLDFRERRIVNTQHENRVTSCSVGTRPDRLDVLLARLGVVLVGRL